MIHNIAVSGLVTFQSVSQHEKETNNIFTNKINHLKNCGKKISSFFTHHKIKNENVKEYIKDNKRTYDRLFNQKPVIVIHSLKKEFQNQSTRL